MKNYKSLYISDLHLNLLENKSMELIPILENNSFNTIYILGDFYDDFVPHKDFSPEEKHLVELLKDAIYIRGNHDYNRSKIDYLIIEDKLLLHGSQVDSINYISGIQSKLIRASCYVLNFLRLLNPILRWKNYSLSELIQENINGRDYIINYKKEIIKLMNKYKCKKVISGHDHIFILDNPYYNAGYCYDGVQGIVETFNGDLIDLRSILLVQYLIGLKIT